MTSKLYFPSEKRIFSCLQHHTLMSKNKKKDKQINKAAANVFADQDLTPERMEFNAALILYKLNKEHDLSEKKLEPLHKRLTAALRDCGCLRN